MFKDNRLATDLPVFSFFFFLGLRGWLHLCTWASRSEPHEAENNSHRRKCWSQNMYCVEIWIDHEIALCQWRAMGTDSHPAGWVQVQFPLLVTFQLLHVIDLVASGVIAAKCCVVLCFFTTPSTLSPYVLCCCGRETLRTLLSCSLPCFFEMLYMQLSEICVWAPWMAGRCSRLLLKLSDLLFADFRTKTATKLSVPFAFPECGPQTGYYLILVNVADVVAIPSPHRVKVRSSVV